jgi:hypothetical protein
MQTLPFFSDPTNLKVIGHCRTARLLKDFADELKAANISVPNAEPETDDYFPLVSALIASPSFPERVRAGLAVIELLAAPPNLEALDAEIARCIPCVSLDRSLPAVDRAMELWFCSRDTALNLAQMIDPELKAP